MYRYYYVVYQDWGEVDIRHLGEHPDDAKAMEMARRHDHFDVEVISRDAARMADYENGGVYVIEPVEVRKIGNVHDN
jgi:hypothetical protein